METRTARASVWIRARYSALHERHPLPHGFKPGTVSGASGVEAATVVSYRAREFLRDDIEAKLSAEGDESFVLLTYANNCS